MKIQKKDGLRGIKISGGNKKLGYAILILIILLLSIMALINYIETKKISNQNNNNNTQLANPASVYCEQNNGTLEIKTAEDGSQTGICISKADKTKSCDEWAFFRGECSLN